MPGRVLVRASHTVTCSSQSSELSPQACGCRGRDPPSTCIIPPALPLCQPQVGSAGWQTATSHHPHLEGVHGVQRPALCTPQALRTQWGPPHMEKGFLGRVTGVTFSPKADQTAEQSPSPPGAIVIPEAEMAELGAGTHTELTGSSQPHRLLKVIRALSTWKRGISERREPGLSCLPPAVTPNLRRVSCLSPACPLVVFSPILTGKPGGRRSVMKSRSLAK